MANTISFNGEKEELVAVAATAVQCLCGDLSVNALTQEREFGVVHSHIKRNRLQ